MRISVAIVKTGPTTAGLRTSIKRATEVAMAELSVALRWKWHQIQNKKLRTSLEAYRAGSDVHVAGGNKLAWDFELTGFLPLAVEFGMGKYDMKPTFLSGPKAKQGKNGPYLVVPFTFYARKPAVARRAQYDKNAIEGARLLSKVSSARTSQQKSSAASRLRGWTKRVSANKGISREGYMHKHAKAARAQKAGGRVMTFRTVSQKSPPNSWVHSGFRRRMLLDYVFKRYLPGQMTKVFEPLFTSGSGLTLSQGSSSFGGKI
jgi:hypothetical protein